MIDVLRGLGEKECPFTVAEFLDMLDGKVRIKLCECC